MKFGEGNLRILHLDSAGDACMSFRVPFSGYLYQDTSFRIPLSDWFEGKAEHFERHKSIPLVK